MSLYLVNRAPGAWLPATDLHETATAYRLLLDVPGLPAEAIHVLLEEDLLTVRGQRPAPADADGGLPRHRERPDGSFVRRFRLPEAGDPAAVTAIQRHGVLEITVPKHARVVPRRIDVAAA